jgi:hypothetical protein
VQAELGFDPQAPAPPLPPPLSPAAAASSKARTHQGGGNKGKGKDKEQEVVKEEDPSGLRFLAKAGVAVVESPLGSGSFVVDTKQSRIDPSAANAQSLM